MLSGRSLSVHSLYHKALRGIHDSLKVQYKSVTGSGLVSFPTALQGTLRHAYGSVPLIPRRSQTVTCNVQGRKKTIEKVLNLNMYVHVKQLTAQSDNARAVLRLFRELINDITIVVF